MDCYEKMGQKTIKKLEFLIFPIENVFKNKCQPYKKKREEYIQHHEVVMRSYIDTQLQEGFFYKFCLKMMIFPRKKATFVAPNDIFEQPNLSNPPRHLGMIKITKKTCFQHFPNHFLAYKAISHFLALFGLEAQN